jgi:hypothetical protein
MENKQVTPMFHLKDVFKLFRQKTVNIYEKQLNKRKPKIDYLHPKKEIKSNFRLIFSKEYDGKIDNSSIAFDYNGSDTDKVIAKASIKINNKVKRELFYL